MGSQPIDDQLPVPLVGRRVALRALAPADYDLLRAVETSPAIIRTWRHRGSTPAPESFAFSIWNGVLVNFVALDRARHDRPIGLYSAYNYDPQNGFVYIAALKFDTTRPAPRLIEAGVLFLDYLFVTWPIRKVYVEATEPNLSQFESLVGTLMVEEGRLVDHLYVEGRYVDMVYLALYRDSWLTTREGLLAYVVGP